MNRAAIVVGGAQRGKIEEDGLSAGRYVAARGESADPVVRARAGGVVHVDELVGRERRIERDAQRSALAARIDAQGDEWRAKQGAILDNTHSTGLLAHENAAVRRNRHERGVRESCNNLHVGKIAGDHSQQRPG
jgi:hypothetical protein